MLSTAKASGQVFDELKRKTGKINSMVGATTEKNVDALADSYVCAKSAQTQLWLHLTNLVRNGRESIYKRQPRARAVGASNAK